MTISKSNNYILDVTFWNDEWTQGMPAYCPINDDGEILFGMTVLGACPGKLLGVFHAGGQEAVEKWCAEHPNWAKEYSDDYD